MARALLVKLLLRLLAWLPLRTVHWLGGMGGRFFCAYRSRLLLLTLTNLELCYPQLDPRQRERLAKQSLIESGKMMLEVGPIWLWDGKEISSLVTEVSGSHLLEQALKRGRGVILALPHLGAWEIFGPYCSMRYPWVALYRPDRGPVLNDFIRACRQRFGGRLVASDNQGVRVLYKALCNNEIVTLLPDFLAKRDSGVFAPFFGVPAKTLLLLPRLAHKTGATVVYGYAERLAKGAGYHLHFLPAPEGIADANLEYAASQANLGIENCIRALPEQYCWFYKRFRYVPGSPQRRY